MSESPLQMKTIYQRKLRMLNSWQDQFMSPNPHFALSPPLPGEKKKKSRKKTGRTFPYAWAFPPLINRFLSCYSKSISTVQLWQWLSCVDIPGLALNQLPSLILPIMQLQQLGNQCWLKNLSKKLGKYLVNQLILISMPPWFLTIFRQLV